jgi:hypothetical protein
MTWNPVHREIFEYLLGEKFEAMTAAALKACKQYATAPCGQQGADYGTERVLVGARNGNGLLCLEDVEKDFGAGIPDSGRIPGDLGSFGSFAAAVLAPGRAEFLASLLWIGVGK